MQINLRNEPMKFINFDTYEVVKRLCASGMPEKQAEEVIHAIISSKEYDLSKLATREQVTDIQRELEKFATKEQVADIQRDLEKFATKEQVADIQRDLEKFATKEQVADIQRDLEKFATKEELFALENKMVTEISKSKDDIVKWMVGLFIALAIAIFVKPYIH
jgi:hypothetical protein